MLFTVFQQAVAKQFERMQKHQMFRVEVERNELPDMYVASFPEGADPIYRKKTEHYCSCCRAFIRAVGNAVAVIDGKLETIWDISVPSEPAYQAVADALAAHVRTKPIIDVFMHTENKAGQLKSFEQMVNGVHTWDHFFVNIDKKFVVDKALLAARLHQPRANKEALTSALTKIDADSLAVVQELISSNSIYRGADYKFQVDAFAKLHAKYRKLTSDLQRELFKWNESATAPEAVSHISGSSIGSLLSDLTKGVELADAVKMFESKVAPANYKRPTALVTKAMLAKAQKDIEELGLTSALQRRHATISDISINNILFANRDAKKVITGSVFDDLTPTKAPKAQSFDKVQEMPIDTFIKDVLPKVDSIEVLLEARHQSNMVSLVAPLDATAGNLFKWNNKFSWSYNGEFADSVKERVKKAGGSVEGDLCCRLGWYNYDDLDFHMIEPGGYEISFRTRTTTSPCGGRLDVDMNASSGQSREAVENIFYSSQHKMKEGMYHLFVENFSRRENIDSGFEVEVDFMDTVYRFQTDSSPRTHEDKTVVRFNYSKAKGIEIIESMPIAGQYGRAVPIWGLTTAEFQKVNVMMLSPNFWDEQGVGNKHYFFMLDGCVNEGMARGFYNEFLKPELEAHRRVFEMIGSKVKAVEAPQQLSGLGFSVSKKEELIVRTKGSLSRMIKLVF